MGRSLPFFTNKMHTPEQILEILNAVRTKPKWPSQVSIPGLSDFDPTHQAEKLKLFEKLHVQGFLTRVRPTGRAKARIGNCARRIQVMGRLGPATSHGLLEALAARGFVEGSHARRSADARPVALDAAGA
jgi:hypothetical protein